MSHVPCVLIPTYDNAGTIRDVVTRARRHLSDVVVVDDGSGAAARREIESLAEEGLARVTHRPSNGGKGAAVKTGFRFARELGFTHALQVDADGQHTLDDIPRFLEASRARPTALVLGEPIFDDTVPRGRLLGRKFTQLWTNIETFGRVIHDPMCGFRVYPLEAAIATDTRGDAMDFDPEIAVRMVWSGCPIENLPTRVRYISREDGGVSHFRMGWDNVFISWMHTRLVFAALFRLLTGRVPRRIPA